MKQKPTTTKEMVSQMWDALLGGGDESIVNRLSRVEDRLDSLARIRSPKILLHPMSEIKNVSAME